MLGALFEFFRQKTQQVSNAKKTKPLRLSTEYRYVTSSNHLFTNQTPDVIKVYENASKLPLMQNAYLSFCEVSGGTQFIGFNRPKKVCGYVIVYPGQYLHKDRARLFKIAQRNGLNIGTLVLSHEQKCIHVKQGDKRYFLVNPESLRLHKWSYTTKPAITAAAQRLEHRS